MVRFACGSYNGRKELSALEAFTKRYEPSFSTEGRLFTFYCDLCGSGYVTPPLNPGKDESDGDLFGRAQAEAKLHFNRCSRCLQWVCDCDYVVELGVCKARAENGG